MLEHLPQYLVAAMLTFSPTENHAYLHESSDYVMARYSDIATDLTKVVLEEDPLDVWDESDEVRRAHTAVLLISIASFESGGFREDVDRQAKSGLGDRGRSRCLMQVMVRPGEQIPDRQSCFRLGLARINESLNACPSNALSERLAVYASGKCSVGRAEASHRWNRMESWWSAAPWYGEVVLDDWLDDKD